MNKTLKKFAIAILATGATVAATRAMATPGTNLVVLDNINVALTVYQQGAPNTLDTSLPAKTTHFTTENLIENLVGVSSNLFGEATSASPTVVKTFKLVNATLYSNVLAGNPGTATNVIVSNVAGQILTASGATATFTDYGLTPLLVNDAGYIAAHSVAAGFATATPTPIVDTIATSNYSALPLYIYSQTYAAPNYSLTLTSSNTYLLTNATATGVQGNWLYVTNWTTATPPVGTASGPYLVYTNVIYTNNAGTLVPMFTFNTNANPITGLLSGSATPIYDLTDQSFDLGYWTEITPVTPVTGTGNGTTTATLTTAIGITEMSPITAPVFTNFYSSVCVETSAGTGATPVPVLVPVNSWVKLSQNTLSSSIAANNNGTIDIYQEAGKSLSTSNFTGANITSQTIYSYDSFSVDTVWPTNAPVQPAGTTNLYLGGNGFTKTVNSVKSLLVDPAHGAAPVSVQVTSSEIVNVAGLGFTGGSFTGTNLTVVGGTTNYNLNVPDNITIGVGSTPYTTANLIGYEETIGGVAVFPSAIGEQGTIASYNNYEENTINDGAQIVGGVTIYPAVHFPEPGYYITGAISVVFNGTITESFLKAYESSSLPFAVAPF